MAQKPSSIHLIELIFDNSLIEAFLSDTMAQVMLAHKNDNWVEDVAFACREFRADSSIDEKSYPIRFNYTLAQGLLVNLSHELATTQSKWAFPLLEACAAVVDENLVKPLTTTILRRIACSVNREERTALTERLLLKSLTQLERGNNIFAYFIKEVYGANLGRVPWVAKQDAQRAREILDAHFGDDQAQSHFSTAELFARRPTVPSRRPHAARRPTAAYWLSDPNAIPEHLVPEG